MPITVNTYFSRLTNPPNTSSASRILPKDMVIGPGQMVVDDSEITLENLTSGGVTTTDTIKVQASYGNGLYCVISGIERDQS